MRPATLGFLLLALLEPACLARAEAAGGLPSPGTEPAGEAVAAPAPSATAPAGEPYLDARPSGAGGALELLLASAGPGSFSPQGDRVAYSRPDLDGYHQLYVARAGGDDERCLTCLPLEFRRRHAGEPAWHPAGRFLVFRLERPLRLAGRPAPFPVAPGRSLGSELWYASDDGKSFGPLTRLSEHGGRAAAARFSHEGDRLAWSERIAAGGDPWGQWTLRVADCEVDRGRPRLGRVGSLRPLPERPYYELAGFTPDDRGLLFAAPAIAGQAADLWIAPLDGGEPRRLTATPDAEDRAPVYTPDGLSLVYASSEGLAGGFRPPSREDLFETSPLDLWRLDLAGGARPARLTRFNDPFSPEYGGRMRVGSPGFRRGGDRLLLWVAPAADPGAGSLWVLATGPPAGWPGPG